MRLPAPITITTQHATLRIDRNGGLRRMPAPRSPYPRAAIWFPGTGTWYELRHHRLLVGRGRRALWRSHLQISSRWRLGVIAADQHGVAFQFEHELYVARLGGIERAVASRELPLGWTPDGLYTYAYRGRRLLLRGRSGRLIKVVARRPLGSDYYVAGGRLYFIRRGVLMSARGTRIERLASLRSLGLSPAPWMQPLRGLLALQDNHRLVLVRDDGSVFGWTRLSLGRNGDEGLIGSFAVSPDGGAVAFATATEQPGNPAPGTETVYLLRSGARIPTRLYVKAGSFGGCARWVNLQWRGRWLLYNATEGYLAAIDTTGHHRAIDLSDFVRRLPGTRDGFSARWSGWGTRTLSRRPHPESPGRSPRA